MKRLCFIGFLLLLLPMGAGAQWRVGLGGGSSYNTYTMDLQYMTDYSLSGMFGLHGTVMGQYGFTDWFAVRAEVDFTQRNWGMNRHKVADRDYVTINNYILLPVMASFSWGGPKLRGFLNLGVYDGFWFSSSRFGHEYNSFTTYHYSFSEQVEFNKEKDQRWDYGPLAGVGIEFHFARHWAIQWEARYWHSMESQVKQYMRVKDYRYNNTFTCQVGMFYCF